MSVHELSHKVPRKAIKAYEKGRKLLAEEKNEEAIAKFRTAVEIDPEFVGAHNDLAAVYLKLARPNAALPHLEAALKFDSQSREGYANLTVAYLMLNRTEDAESAVRRLCSVDGNSSHSRLLLGLALVMNHRYGEETVSALAKAESEFPQASLLLGRAFAANGKLADAREKIRQYMASGETSGLELANEWLRALEQPTVARR